MRESRSYDPELYRKVKESVTMQQAVEYCGLRVIKDKCLCPFHKDQHPSMKIYPDGKGYYCFACGSGGDAIHNTQYTFTGLPDVYDRVMMDVAGAARTPVTKLFGRSPAGMNSTGESDLKNYYDYIDGLRETELRGIIERLLPIMALSAWGRIPDDMDIDFPPMQTPDAKDVAEITERKSNAILAAYQNDLIDAATAMQELKSLSDETGLYSKITDEAIEAGKGKFYSDSRSMQDPMAGFSFPGSTGEDDVGDGNEDSAAGEG